MFHKILIALTIPVALSGCATGYSQFYKPANGITPEFIAQMRAAPPPSTPLVERIPPINGAAVTDAYSKRLYSLICCAEFNSGRA